MMSLTNIVPTHAGWGPIYDSAVLKEFGILKIFWPDISQSLMFYKYLISCCFHSYK
jgi:hypothetical protein